MRVIKYRAWDILTKKMQSWGDIFDLPAWEIFPGTPEQRPYEIMQYTGLKDKNGVEIYEGDIAKLQDGHTSYYVVEWHKNGMWIFRFLDNEHQYYSFNSVCDFMYTVNHEVIGNIYENPELLNDELPK